MNFNFGGASAHPALKAGAHPALKDDGRRAAVHSLDGEPSDIDPTVVEAVSARDQTASAADPITSDKQQATSDREQATSDREQASSDREQAASDREQASSDREQASSDREQAASDTDQATSDRNQVASDRQQAAHVPGFDVAFETALRRVHDDARAARQETTTEREAATQERAATGFERTANAIRRDEHAALRDLTAEVRDRAAEARDRAIAEYELANSGDEGAAAARLRAEAAADRARATQDRERGAEDRRQAAREREQLETELENAQLDHLTGFYLRGLGTAILQREIDRSRRSDSRLVLIYIDVDRLKQMNDEHGHDAGDRLLVNVAEAIRSRLRSYDPVVRMGGDEFVCIVSQTDLDAARSVIRAIQEALAERQPGASITAGLAALEDNDSLGTLCARADAALRELKFAQAQQSGSPA